MKKEPTAEEQLRYEVDTLNLDVDFGKAALIPLRYLGDLRFKIEEQVSVIDELMSKKAGYCSTLQKKLRAHLVDCLHQIYAREREGSLYSSDDPADVLKTCAFNYATADSIRRLTLRTVRPYELPLSMIDMAVRFNTNPEAVRFLKRTHEQFAGEMHLDIKDVPHVDETRYEVRNRLLNIRVRIKQVAINS